MHLLLPRILHKHCFQFLFGRLWYPEEMKNKGYAIFFFFGGGGEQISCIMGNVEVMNDHNLMEEWEKRMIRKFKSIIFLR